MNEQIEEKVEALQANIKGMFNVEGFVDNVNYEDDEQASYDNMYFNLSSWLIEEN
jgi:hypothetical protein